MNGKIHVLKRIAFGIPNFDHFRLRVIAISTDLGGEAVILGLQSESYFSVDGVDLRLWELLETPTPPPTYWPPSWTPTRWMPSPPNRIY